jgi:hypothetical protein
MGRIVMIWRRKTQTQTQTQIIYFGHIAIANARRPQLLDPRDKCRAGSNLLISSAGLQRLSSLGRSRIYNSQLLHLSLNPTKPNK